MKEKVIIIYEELYAAFLRANISEDTEVIKWLSVDRIETELVRCTEELYPYYQDRTEPVTTCVMVVTREKKEIAMQLVRELNAGTGGHILDVYKTYMAGFSGLRYRRIMDKNGQKKVDGLILGISHGQAAIVEERMPGNALNFCESHQDIYYNGKVLEKICEEYQEQMKELEYVVFEMFDYDYFNYDVLQTGNIMPFLEESGFSCETREPWKKSYSPEAVNRGLERIRQEGTKKGEEEVLLRLFPAIRTIENRYRGFSIFEERNVELTDGAIGAYQRNPYFAAIQLRIFPQVLLFQIDNFREILERLYRLNPKIKICLLLLPKFQAVEEKEQQIKAEWKPYFMSVIEQFRQKYPELELIDLKECSELSGRRDLYYDLQHLNYKGSCQFTDWLAKKLQKEYGLNC